MTRNQQLIRFLIIFGCLWGLIHFYLFLRIIDYLELNKSQQTVMAWLVTMMGVTSLLILPFSRQLPRGVSTICAWIAYTWMGMAFLFVSAFFIADVIHYFSELFFSDWIYARSIYSPYRIGVCFLLILTLIGVYALYNALRTVMIRHINISIKKLPVAFEGLRIVQISDVHIGSILGRKWLDKVVAQINQLDPDLVFITGDLVDGSINKLAMHVQPLTHLQSRYGCYFVTGNHEYYSGAKEWCEHFLLLGIRVLKNERISIIKDGTSIDIAGVNDWSTRHHPDGYNLEKAVANRDQDTTLILLSHQPVTMHEAAKKGVDLQLSGHTHGGQIWPFNYLVYLQQPFVQGLFQHPEYDFQMYVSPGTGFWGPPMRLATRAEITHITLFNS